MAVDFDVASQNVVTGGTLSWTHTPILDPSIVVIPVALWVWSGSGGISSVTYGGESCTNHVVVAIGERYAYLWYRLNPLLGPRAVYVYSTTGNSHIMAGCGSFLKSIRSGTPLRTGNSGSGTGISSSLSPASRGGEMVVDCINIERIPGTLTPGAYQTTRWSYDDLGATSYFRGSTRPGADSTAAVSWSWLNSKNWAHVAASIIAAPSGSQVIGPMLKRMRDFMRDLRQGLLPPDVLLRRWGEAFGRPI